ncbi:DUF924 domain-containing protein [Paracoccus bogoriensis]|nr:DUF924 domain-containing protein [Paracoccus bogoriensis]
MAAGAAAGWPCRSHESERAGPGRVRPCPPPCLIRWPSPRPATPQNRACRGVQRDAKDRSVALYEALGNEKALHFARDHRDIIARFGRFPHRNAILGRDTTPDEAAFLKTHSGF